MAAVDKVDAQILGLLQQEGRISQHDLARAVGLSAPAVAERLRKLEERGFIKQFTALLDAQALGWDITAFISVGISGSRHFSEFRARVEEQEEVQECHSVTGEGSHLLKVRARNTAALERLLAQIQAWPGVQWTATSIVLSSLKESSSVPIPVPGGSREEEIGPGDLLHVPFRTQA